jgi:pimeloyl-ACP methyl ester carboxylesterase
MSTITTKDGTQIYYNDWGTGQPVVFSHGWPLSADAWEDQMFFLCNHGYHVTLVKDATAAFSKDRMHAAHELNGPNLAHAILTTAELIGLLPTA